MVHGMLVDPHNEFFITHRENVTESSKQTLLYTSQEFQLQPVLVPTYLPVSVAEKILFVGTSVHLLNKQEKNALGTEFISVPLNSFRSTFSA